MSQQRLPMVKIREVLRLQAEGHKQRKIAASVNCSRSTVQECLQRARSAGAEQRSFALIRVEYRGPPGVANPPITCNLLPPAMRPG